MFLYFGNYRIIGIIIYLAETDLPKAQQVRRNAELCCDECIYFTYLTMLCSKINYLLRCVMIRFETIK